MTLGWVLYSPIHKAAGSLVTGRSLQNGKMSMGNRRTERPPDPVLYGGRPSGGFVNRAVMQLRTEEGSRIFFWFTPRSSIDYDRQIWWNSSGTVRNSTWPWGIDWYRNKTKFVKCWRSRQKKRYSFWQHHGLHKVKIVVGLSLIQIGFKICISSKSRFQYKRIKGFSTS